MGSSYRGARRSLALLAVVGTAMGHGPCSASQHQAPPARLGVRRPLASLPSRGDEIDCKRASPRSAVEATAACPRGGAIDEGDAPYRRSGGYDRDDDRRPPPRRPEYSEYDRPRPGPRRDDPRRDGGRRAPPGERERRDRRYDDLGGRSGRGMEYRDGRRGYYDERVERGRGRGPGDNDRPATDTESDGGGGKKKKWFSRKKDNEEEPTTIVDVQEDVSSNIPPPPPPPPPLAESATSTLGADINPAETERTPIHYMFPTAEEAAEGRLEGDTGMDRGESTADDPDLPFLDVDEEEFPGRDGSMDRRRRRRMDDDEEERYRASPRRDAVTVYMSTRRGALQVRLGSAIVGAALGGFLGKSLTNDPATMAVAVSSVLFLAGFLRNDYGELSRALGLALVFTLKRTRSVRKEYPTLPHLKAMIRQSPRRPFPPVEEGSSPWKYEPIYRDDPEFKMTYALFAMALVGSFCGGNVPLIPAWMGGILGAVAFASFTTGANARGDLGRSMGMRVVGLVQVVLAINSELRILGKAATVGGLVFDKFMIMDRKHRIKDRIVAICKWGYDKVSRTAEQVKEDMQEERPERREPDRREPDRRERR